MIKVIKTFHTRRKQSIGVSPEEVGAVWRKSFLFLGFIYLFSERGEGREKERERNIDWLPLACPQLGTWLATHQPRHMPWLGIGSATLYWVRPARALFFFYFFLSFVITYCLLFFSLWRQSLLIDWYFFRERGAEKETWIWETPIDCILHVPPPGIEPTTFRLQDNAPVSLCLFLILPWGHAYWF